jgi:outer membrane receptor protein involved in Fe transport
MSTNSKLQTAVRLALGVSAGALAVSVAPSAFAQDSGADDVIEEIVTTGSRIKRADLESASPVTVIDQDDILVTGVTDVGQLLQRLPSMGGSPIGTTTNNGGNGSVQIDLRGLGVVRTLTLVNGRRTVDGGDYQTIPAAMIERVEILKDGASAVYGADAVAGVVNIITKQNYDGIQIDAQVADWFDSAGGQTSISIMAGKTFDGGSFLLGAEYVDQEEAYQSDTQWDYFQDSFFIYPGGCEKGGITRPYDGTGDPATSGCYIVGSSRIPASRIGFVNQGTFLIDDAQAATTPYEVGMMVPHDGRTYNYAPVNYIQTPYERTNLWSQASMDLSDTMTLSGELRTNIRSSSQELAPMPYNSPTDPGYASTFGGVAYNGISEDNYYLTRAVDAYNANPANAGNQLAYEPLGDARRRMIETTRRFEQDITQTQVGMTLAGSFNEIDWDVYYYKGWRARTDVDYGQFFGPNLSNAFGPSADLDGDGQPECYADVNDASTLIAGCVPFNFFGGGVVNADGTPSLVTVTPDMINYVGIDLVDTFRGEQDQGGFDITGAIFELPGGQMGWAAGYSYRKEAFDYQPDSAKQKDEATGNTGTGTNGEFTNDSVYGEVFLPVFDNGSQNLNLSGGLRWDDFSTYGDDTTYQLGIEFGIIESLKVRSTYGTVFRAPNIGESFGGQVDSFPTYLDPCDPNVNAGVLAPGCDQTSVQLDTQVLARVGGNPDLVAETGDTFTAGVVWTPEFGDSDLSITIDYWQVELENLITTSGVQPILDNCYRGEVEAFCSLITRRTTDYSVAQILDAPINAAFGTAGGIDTEIRWNFDTAVGEWEAAVLWAHNTDRTTTPFEGEDEVDLLGTFSVSGNMYAEDKMNYSLGWFRNDFSIRYLGEYIGPVTASVSFIAPDEYTQDIDSQLYHDLIFGYDLQSTGTRFSGGITNFTDEEPPYIDIGFNASTDPSTYRLFGIGYYLRISQSFQ